MGPPAAGKGTYASLMKEEFEIPHISTGDLFTSRLWLVQTMSQDHISTGIPGL